MTMCDFNRDEVSTWEEHHISDVLDLITHDTNNIAQAIRGYALLLRIKMEKGELTEETIEEAIEVFLSQTKELKGLMKNTAAHSKYLRRNF